MSKTEDVSRKATRLAQKVSDRAHDLGLIEVAYTTTDSPFGDLLVAGSNRGLVAIGLPGSDTDELLKRVSAELSPRILRMPRKLEQPLSQLDEYFSGRRSEFDLALDRRLARGFQAKALDVVAAIPYGRTATYTEVATAAGSPRAFRAAGTACARNPLPLVIPCHRIVGRGGGLGGYGGGLAMKRALLALEGAHPSRSV